MSIEVKFTVRGERPEVEANILRIANRPMGSDENEIVQKLLAEGVSPEDVFLARAAARILVKE